MFTVGYTMDTIVFKWLTPKDKAVQFDKGSKAMPQFVIQDFDLLDCSKNDTDCESCAFSYTLVSGGIGRGTKELVLSIFFVGNVFKPQIEIRILVALEQTTIIYLLMRLMSF